MASMNRGLNLPQIQRIMTEFEKESSMMDMKEEMMSDAVDDVMDEEDEEEEGDNILKQVLDEIGVDLSHQVRFPLLFALVRYLSHCSAYGGSNGHRCGLQIPGRSTTCRTWGARWKFACGRRQRRRRQRQRCPRPFR
jgi:hypothetical protein